MKDSIKKIQKYVKIAKFAASVAVIAMTVYTLIPKSEKITDIDTLPLQTLGAENEEAPEVEAVKAE